MQKVIPNIQMQATYHLVVHKRASITGITQSTFIILSPSATQTNFISGVKCHCNSGNFSHSSIKGKQVLWIPGNAS